MNWNWTVKSTTGESFADVGDRFTATSIGNAVSIKADCQKPINKALWEGSVAKSGSGDDLIEGKLANGFSFLIRQAGPDQVECEITDPAPGRPQGASGGWSGDETQ